MLNFILDGTDHSFLKFWVTMGKISPKMLVIGSQRAKNHIIGVCEQNIHFKFLRVHIEWILCYYIM